MSLYRRSFAFGSALTPDELRDRLRLMVKERRLPQTARFRLWQIAGWAYQEHDTAFTLRAYPWSGNGRMLGAALVGRVEAAGAGSRIVGVVREHWLVEAIATVLLGGTAVMMLASLREHHWTWSREVAGIVAMSTTIVAACVLMVRLDLRVNEGMIRDGLNMAASITPSTHG